MAIYQEQQSEFTDQVITKEIDAGAHEMIADLVQKYQYQYPEKSAVRELTSNAIDAVTEKKNAVAILTGAAKPEDFYVERSGPLFKDSKWDPSYYDLNYLSDENKVYLTYYIREDQRDLFVIKDHGVGLWSNRLLGYFKLGFSTKRANKNALGKYGIGAKSALSTGVNYYVVENRYNGKLMRFQVFDHSYQSIIPQFNLVTGNENPYVVFESNGQAHKFHYLPTAEPNGLTIELEVKKHNQQKYLDAVASQLMYFNNIELAKVDQNGHREIIPHSCDVIFETDRIVLSDNSFYSKPHMLLNNVCYGYIDFRELEMEERYGNIGIKVNPDEVTINPSRESLIWDDVTRATILRAYETVKEEATNLLNKTFETTNFVDWLFSVNSIDTFDKLANRNNVISRLSKIANLNEIVVSYKNPDTGMEHSLRGLSKTPLPARLVRYSEAKKGGAIIHKITRTRHSIRDFRGDIPIFIKSEPGAPSNKRDKYIYQKYGDFILLEHYSHALHYGWYLEAVFGEHSILTQEEKDRTMRFLEFIFELFESNVDSSAYSDKFLLYESIDVSNINLSDDEEDMFETAVEEEEEKGKSSRMSAAELRKLNGRTTVGLLLSSDSGIHMNDFRSHTIPLVNTVAEIDIASIPDLDSEELFYYNANEVDESMAMKALWISALSPAYHRASLYTDYIESLVNKRDYTMYRLDRRFFSDRLTNKDAKDANSPFYFQNYSSIRTCSYNKELAILRVAKNNLKYFKQFKHISAFFAERRGNSIRMSNKLSQWNTARIIQRNLHKCRFLSKFDQFNPEMAEEYSVIYDYVRKYFVPLTDIDKQGFKSWEQGDAAQLEDHCERIYQFQRLVHTAVKENIPNAEKVIAESAIATFGDSTIQNAHGADMDLITRFERMLDYCEQLPMLNMIPALTGDSVSFNYVFKDKVNTTLSYDEEQEILHYIKSKTSQV